MKLVDEALLERFRRYGPCEFCGKPGMLCPAHIFSKGAGRVDVVENLVGLGLDAIRDCPCHANHHNGGRPTVKDLELIVALREGIDPTSIKEEVDRIRRMPQPKDGQARETRRKMPKPPKWAVESRKAWQRAMRAKIKATKLKKSNRGMS